MERVAIYNRCSTEEEAQINALAIQAAESRERAVSKGWRIADQYIESESGTRAANRSEYLRLLRDMDGDKFDIIMIKSIDRLMRSAKDWYFFLDKLTRSGKKLYIYIDDKYYTPEDSLISGIKAILAEDFSRELSKKIKNAHRRRQERKSGLNITVPMFGWNRLEKDVYEINQEEAEAYRQAFEMVKEGKGFYSLANDMYERGVRGKKGERISDVQWRKMLYSPRAWGTVVLHTREYDFDRKRYVSLPEEEWIYVEGALPPIVSREYHQEFLERMASCRRRDRGEDVGRRPSGRRRYSLSGRLCCGECGRVYYRMGLPAGKGGRIRWKCSRALKQGRRHEGNPEGCSNINVLEEELLKAVEAACRGKYDMLSDRDEEIVREALAVIREGIGGDSGKGEEPRLEKEWGRLLRKQRVLLDKLTDEVISDKDYQTANRELEARLTALRVRREGIKKAASEYNECEKRLSAIRRVLQAGDLLTRARTRELILEVEKIYIHSDGRLEIILDGKKLEGVYPV